jgi:hypothetical protein
VKLKRFQGNPILCPNPANGWEDLAVFNPAAWYDEDKKQVLLLYKAAESGPEYKCYFGLAVSRDGYNFERLSDQPVLSPSVDGFDASTIQDPRMVKMGEYYYITYACRFFPFGQFWMPKGQQYVRPVCPADFPRVIRNKAKNTWYAIRRVHVGFNKWKHIKMHREILDPPDHLFVDHINHHGYDNRKANLRTATHRQNSYNRIHFRKNPSSKYKGVSWNRYKKKWSVQIRYDGRSKFIGFFDDQIEAAKAYDKAAKKHQGEFAVLNFKE